MRVRSVARAVLSGLAVISVAAAALAVSGAPGVARTATVPPPCAPPGPTQTPTRPTTITTIEQAYYCVFANYYSGPVLDDRVLLAGAFPPFAGGVLSPGAVSPLLLNTYPLPAHVMLRLQRPATGRTWTVTLAPAPYNGPPPAVSARLLDGHIAYVAFPEFFPGAASQVLADIASMAKKATLHGVIVDLRGNTGFSGDEVTALLGAFEHGRAYDYNCDVQGICTPTYPDASTPLLHLPLVVLTDRGCLSACEVFAAGVKDLRLGTLVGTRTGGIVAGPATGYLLDDGSALALPAEHTFGAGHEIINGIGVAPDYDSPITARGVSTGHDPDIAKALNLLNT